MIRRTDAGQHQQLGRVDDSTAKDDFTSGSRSLLSPISRVLDACHALAFYQELRRLRTCDDVEIRTAKNRQEKRFGGAVSTARFDVFLVVTGAAFGFRRVEFPRRVRLESVNLRGGQKGRVACVSIHAIRDGEWA